MPELNIIGAKEDNRYFPYQGALRVTRKTFWTAGQDSFTNPPAQNPDMFQALTNVEPVNQGNLKRRRGYQLLSNQSPVVPYREGFSFRSESLGLRSQVWTSASTPTVAGNVLALNEDGSAYLNTIFTPALNTPYVPRMVLSRNHGYFADGAPSDNLKWDGTPKAGNLTNWGIDINNVAGATFGPNNPGTVADQGSGSTNGSQGPASPSVGVSSGSPAWSGAGNIFAADGVVATVPNVPATSGTGALSARGYSFSVPATATITGVVVKILRSGTNPSEFIRDAFLFLQKAGVNVGTNNADTVTRWPNGSLGYATYGSSSDLSVWGLTPATLTPADVNNAGFGAQLVAFNASFSFTGTPRVDYISITVYYTVASTGSWTPANALPSSALATTSQSSDLRCTGYGLAPVGAIQGIQVDINCQTTSGAPTINPVLVKHTIGPTGQRKIASVTTTSANTITFGGPFDLWQTSWAQGDINGQADFGVQFFVLSSSGNPTVTVNTVKITVFTGAGAPTFTLPAGSITLISGTVYTVAFQNSLTQHVSNFCPFSNNTGPLTAQNVQLNNILVSQDPQVDTKLVLRPADGADTTTLYLVATIPNSQTSYLDSMTEATLLTQPVFQQTDQNGILHGIANNKRPPLLNFPTKHKGRIYGSIQSTLFYSKNLDEVVTSTGTITSKWEESWPATNQQDVSETAETVQGILSDGETLWIGTERCIRRLVGDSPSNFQKPEIQFNEAGLLNQDSWRITFHEGQPVGTMWLTPDFRVMFSDFNNYQDVGTPIQDVLNSINPIAVASIHASFVSKGPAEYYMLYVPIAPATAPNIVCIYSLRTKKWCIWQPTDLITGSMFFIDALGAPRWPFATNAGPLYEWGEKLLQDRVNNTPLPYAVPITTSWLDFGDEGLTKAFNKIIVTTADPSLTIAVQGAITDTDLDTGGVLVLPPTPVQAEIFGDLFVPMVAQPGFYKWYQLTFTSPATNVADVLDAFDFEIIPAMRM